MRTSRFSVGLLLLAALAFAIPAPAQQKPPQEMLMVMQLQVRPGMGLEWENYLKKDLLPAMKKAGMKQITTARTNELGVTDSYAFWWPIASLAELDGPGSMQKALGPEGVPVLLANVQRCVAGGRTFLLASQPEIRIAAKPGYVYKAALMVRQTVAPGRDAEYMKSAREAIGVLSKTSAKAVYVNRVGPGGNPNEFHWFIALDSFADLEQFGQAFGKAAQEAKLAPLAGIVTSAEMEFYSILPELSIE